MSTYGAGSQALASLTGAEKIDVDNGGATKVTATAQQIAGLAGTGAASVVTALNTVGAGTVTAAGIIGKVTVRGGSQSNTGFTDTTATAAQLIAALTNPVIGQSWEWTYQNTTNATATLAGGTGVTVSGVTTVQAGASARYLVTYSAANTFTVVGILQTDPATANGTVVANGATPVTVADKRLTANSVVIFSLKTVGGTVGAYPAIQTVTPGTGFTVAATALDTSTYNYLIVG